MSNQPREGTVIMRTSTILKEVRDKWRRFMLSKYGTNFRYQHGRELENAMTYWMEKEGFIDGDTEESD